MIDLSLTSQLVGSYRKPRWIANHDGAYQLDTPWWSIPDKHLAEAHDDSVRMAIADQERAGLDVITDGEQRRQSFTAYWYRFGGLDTTSWGPRGADPQQDMGKFVTRRETPSIAGNPARAPRVTGPITWPGPMSVDHFQFLQHNTRRATKVMVTGPATLAVRLSNEYYADDAALMLALADAINQEILALEAAGADIIQIDDPEIHFSLNRVRGAATEALTRCVRGVKTTTAVHICYGYARNTIEKRVNPAYAEALELIAASDVDEISMEYEQPGHEPDVLAHCGDKGIILGLLNLSTEAPVETVDHIVARTRAALEVVPAERLRLAPDCGMWFLDRDVAYRKILNLAAASRAVRSEHGL